MTLIASTIAGMAPAEEAKGTFGFAAKVDVVGFLNPTLKAVHVQSVEAGRPAAQAGIVAGDSILEVEGITIAGANAYAIADRMKKKPGESVVLKLLRASGETYVVTLMAVTPKQ